MVKKALSKTKKTAKKKKPIKKTEHKVHEIKLKKDDYEITITETPIKRSSVRKKPEKKMKKSMKRKSSKTSKAKGVRKKTSKAKKVRKKTPKKKAIKVVRKAPEKKSTKEIGVEKALMENFVGLQKVMVNLSSRFDELSTQISGLLNLFEVSARAMAKKEFSRSSDPDLVKVIDKLDNLSQHAGLIGRGLALIHEVNEESQGRKIPEPYFEPRPIPTNFRPKPLPTNPSLRNPNLGPRPIPPQFKPQPLPTTPPLRNPNLGQTPQQPQFQGSTEMQPSIMKPKDQGPTQAPQRIPKKPFVNEVDESGVPEKNV